MVVDLLEGLIKSRKVEVVFYIYFFQIGMYGPNIESDSIIYALQTEAPDDLYTMTVDPKKAPDQSERLEIEFKKGLSLY